MYQSALLKDRSKRFALEIIGIARTLTGAESEKVIARQLLRSGTSVAANYRACCRARSKAEFVAKMGVVVGEADETVFWLEVLMETGMSGPDVIRPLLKEANELLAIFAASYHTAKNG